MSDPAAAIRALQDLTAARAPEIWAEAMRRAHPHGTEVPGDTKARIEALGSRRLEEFLLGGEVGTCPHVPLNWSEAFWFPGTPLILCPPCAQSFAQARIGTPEDFTCDGCRRVMESEDRMYNGVISRQAPYQKPGDPVCLLQVPYDLCEECAS